jgi:hypothetical protein
MDVVSELCVIRNILVDGGSKSKTSGNFFVLPVNGVIMELYFSTEYGPDVGIPKGSIVRIPKKKVNQMIILNEGNADIFYEVNALPGELKLGSILRAQEDVQIESRQFRKDIFSVFIQAEVPTGPNIDNAIGVGSTNGPNWLGDLSTAHVRLETRA